MDKAVFKDYLDNRYYDQLKYYDGSAQKHKKRYQQFQWLVIILSAITPVLAGLDGTEFSDATDAANIIRFKIPVVILSAAVAILTTGLKTFNYLELWTSYRTTQEQLKPEIHYYNLRVGPYAEPGVNRERLFVSRVEAILDKEHKSWPPARKLDENSREEATEEPTEEARADEANPEPGAAEPTPTT